MKQTKLIHVEDNNEANKVISHTLQEIGCQTITVETHNDILTNIAEINPDIILISLLDLESDNWKLHQQFRQLDKTANIPILLITERSQQNDFIPGLVISSKSQIDDYITYPFETSQLTEMIEVLLTRAPKNE